MSDEQETQRAIDHENRDNVGRDYWARVQRYRETHTTTPHRTAEMHVLAEMMDFDHVVQVLDDGTVIDRNDIWGPELHDYESGPVMGMWHGLDRETAYQDRWTLLNGYSGQDRYAGPIMHESEYIGGQMARDILETPGVYVAVIAYCSPEGDDEDETDVGGWAVAKLDD